MGNQNEVIILALKDFEVAGMNYVAGNKYALSPEIIATLEEGTVELVKVDEAPATETVVVPNEEVTPQPEVETTTTPEVADEVNQVSPEVTPEETPAEPTPEVDQAPVEEPKPWAGNHTVAS